MVWTAKAKRGVQHKERTVFDMYIMVLFGFFGLTKKTNRIYCLAEAKVSYFECTISISIFTNRISKKPNQNNSVNRTPRPIYEADT
jgi:hypothetical protein